MPPNPINALIVFGALEDKNGISQSLQHGTEIKPQVTFKSNREPRSLIMPHGKGKVQRLREASEIDSPEVFTSEELRPAAGGLTDESAGGGQEDV